MTDKKTTPTPIKDFSGAKPVNPEERIEKLEIHILQLRRLHADALQMLVTMGRDLLQNQQTLLNAVADMRVKYEAFAEFIEKNAAHLPEPPVADTNETVE